MNLSYKEITAKRVTPIFFMFNKLENCFTLIGNNIYR